MEKLPTCGLSQVHKSNHEFLSFKYLPISKDIPFTQFLFLNMGQSRPLFCLFPSFSHHKSITNWKSIDGVLGIWTWGRRMEGADETSELPLHAVSYKSNSPPHMVILLKHLQCDQMRQILWSVQQNFLQKSPKYLVTFRTISKNHLYF